MRYDMKYDPKLISKLETLLDSQIPVEPILYETGKTFRVNSYTVEQIEDEWAVMHASKMIARFYYRSWAVAWAVAINKGDMSTCSYLMSNNQRLNKLRCDKVLYKHYLKHQKDELKLNILEDRLAKTEQDINELVWDTHQVMRYQGFV